MSLVTRILLTGSLALCGSALALAQHAGGGHSGGGFGRGAAASGYGGQAFAAPSIGTMNSTPPGTSSRFAGPSIGTLNAVPPGRARLGYGGQYPYRAGYGYNNYGYNNYGRNRTYPFAYWLTPYYYPGLFYDSGFYDNYPYQVGDVAQPPEDQQQDLAENMPSEAAPYPPYYPPVPYAMPPQGAYAPPGYYYGAPYYSNAPASSQTSETQPATPVTLVLNSGETLKVQNYAVMGSTFWDFSKQPARRIPVSSINIPASTKATEANGAEFPPIS